MTHRRRAAALPARPGSRERVAMGSRVELGFVEAALGWRLGSAQFPSKVGGWPAWLGEAGLPDPAALSCGRCGRPCAFLLQLYAPLAGRPDAFHRTLLLFCCRHPTCHRPAPGTCPLRGEIPAPPPGWPRPARALVVTSPRSLLPAAFRNQLPRVNATYPPEPPPLLPPAPLPARPPRLRSGAALCRVCGCLAPKRCARCRAANYCGRAHQELDWAAGHRRRCRPGQVRSGGTQLLPFLAPCAVCAQREMGGGVVCGERERDWCSPASQRGHAHTLPHPSCIICTHSCIQYIKCMHVHTLYTYMFLHACILYV